MKKTLLITVILSFCFSASVCFAEEEKTDSYVNEAYVSVANDLLDVILSEVPFNGGQVTRGEFVGVVSKLLKADTATVTDAVYTDVAVDYPYAKAIKAAVDFKWVSKGETFRPDDNITLSEALKIVVSAAGYAEKAEFGGGFPNGYFAEADELELLEGIKMRADGLLDCNQAKVLMYNLLNADWSDRTYLYTVEGVHFPSAPSGRTILSVFHGIEKTEGVINSTSYNSFEYNTPVNVNVKKFSIRNETYEYSKITPDLLGKYAYVFYEKDTEKAVVVNTALENNILKYDLKDIEFKNENLVEYIDDNGKSEEIELTGGILTYNGRTVRTLDGECFEGDGYAVFVDNNDDDIFDIIHVTAYSYIVVGSIDRLNRKIGDVNDDAYSLNLKDCRDELIQVYDENNEELSWYNIVQGDVFEVVAPKDMSFATLRMVTTQVKGAVEMQTEESAVINGSEYYYSRYFTDNCLKNLTLGISDSYYIGYNNILIMPKNGKTSYQYGFILNVYSSAGEAETIVRMYTEDGKKKELEVSEKLMVDGARMNASELIAKYAQLSDSDRLVKYIINSKNKITKIDFPVVYDYANFEEQTRNVNDSLVYYSGYAQTMTYRNNVKTFTGKVALLTSKCFMIPENLNDEISYFKSGVASSVMKHNVPYTSYIYDMDEEGSAGMVVVRGIDSNISTEASYLVEKVTDGIDNEGNPAKVVTCFKEGQYCTYYMSYDTEIKKDSGNTLEAGDIIRVKTDSNNYIYTIQVDFDYGNFAINSKASTLDYMKTGSSKSYWTGLAYSVSSSGMVQLASEKDKYGEYDFSQYKLNPMSVRSNIVRFDCETKQLRPITFDEIKSYRAFGDDCEFVVLCSDYDVSKMAVVYDNHKNR